MLYHDRVNQDSSTANQTCGIRFHVSKEKKQVATEKKTSCRLYNRKNSWKKKNAFFSKMIKNVLNVRYIYDCSSYKL